MTRATAVLLWALWIAQFCLLEGYAIGRGQFGNTLSAVVRDDLRFDPVGRWVTLSLLCWCLWHFGFRPQQDTSISWRDLAFVCLGLAWAYAEVRLRTSI